MTQYDLDEWLRSIEPEAGLDGLFNLIGPRLLAVKLDGRVWAKAGSMVAYRGGIRFTREGILEHGLGRLLKEAFTSEGLRLMKAEGLGVLYLADAGKKICILNPEGQTLCVNGNDVLAFEPDLEWDVRLMKKISGVLSGGLFSVRFGGHGLIALSCHHDWVRLTVRPGQPLVTDPNATVAWSGSLKHSLQTDVSLRTFVGRGSGESLQMRFEGEGWVIVQPCEEIPVLI